MAQGFGNSVPDIQRQAMGQEICNLGAIPEALCALTQAANPFGQPFLFQIEDDETLEDVKPRIKVSHRRLSPYLLTHLVAAMLHGPSFIHATIEGGHLQLGWLLGD